MDALVEAEAAASRLFFFFFILLISSATSASNSFTRPSSFLHPPPSLTIVLLTEKLYLSTPIVDRHCVEGLFRTALTKLVFPTRPSPTMPRTAPFHEDIFKFLATATASEASKPSCCPPEPLDSYLAAAVSYEKNV